MDKVQYAFLKGQLDILEKWHGMWHDSKSCGMSYQSCKDAKESDNNWRYTCSKQTEIQRIKKILRNSEDKRNGGETE